VTETDGAAPSGDLNSAVQAAWDDPVRLRGLITSAMDHGQADGLVAAARRLYAIDPYPSGAVGLLALVLRTNADHEGAERVLVDHLRVHGGDAETWFHLAPLAAWRGDPSDMDEALERSLGYDPNHAQALDFGFRQRQRTDGTEAAIHWLWQHSAQSWRAHVMLGRQALEWGETVRAIEYFTAAAELGPHDPGPLAEGGRALYDHGLDAELSAFVLDRWRGTHGPMPLVFVAEADLRQGKAAEAALAMGRLRGLVIPPAHQSAVADLETRVRAACQDAGL
jgi:Flp pilus assembly protein TadD